MKDGLKSKVQRFKPSNDGRPYVPFCMFEKHQGIILREKVCIRRNCQHYQKLYLPTIGRVDGRRR